MIRAFLALTISFAFDSASANDFDHDIKKEFRALALQAAQLNSQIGQKSCSTSVKNWRIVKESFKVEDPHALGTFKIAPKSDASSPFVYLIEVVDGAVLRVIADCPSCS